MKKIKYLLLIIIMIQIVSCDFFLDSGMAKSTGGSSINENTTVQPNLSTDGQQPDTQEPTTLLPVHNLSIELIGESLIEVVKNGTFNDPGATALDSIDGDLTSSIKKVIYFGEIETNKINTAIIRDYKIVYSVTNSANQTKSVERMVKIVEESTFSLTLVGEAIINLEVGESYVEQGAIATCSKDGNVDVDIIIKKGNDVVSSIDTSTVGSYTITYSATNSIGMNKTVTRIVNVNEVTHILTISLNGSATIEVNVGASFSDPGATATDSVDGTLAVQVVIKKGSNVVGSVDTSVEGSYVITYSATNSANETKSVTREVNVVSTSRVFNAKLVGENIISVEHGSTYLDPGIDASDSVDGVVTNITTKIVDRYGSTVTAINTDKENAYHITYTIKNSINSTKTLNRTVLVKSKDEVVSVENSGVSSGNIITVSNKSGISSAISSLSAGKMLVFEDGTYNGLGTIDINKSGTKDKPIIVIARNPGQVFITGTSTIKISGNYVILAGFVFKDGQPNDKNNGAIVVKGSYNRVHNNTIYNFDPSGCNSEYYDPSVCPEIKWISLDKNYNQADHNSFIGKRSRGTLFVVWRSNTDPNYHLIYDNLFQDFQSSIVDKETCSSCDNGWEGIRLGDSTNSQSNSNSLVENNVFDRVNGEIEIVSNKSGGNVYNGNMFYDSVGLLTIRHGKGVTVVNNIFKFASSTNNAGGIRMYDTDHIIRNNYIENVRGTGDQRAGIVVHSGNNNEDGIDLETNKPIAVNGQWVAKNILIENNSIIEARQGFLYSGKESVNPENITFKNNLVSSTVSNSKAVNISGEKGVIINPAYSGEVYYAKELGMSTISGVSFSSSSAPTLQTIGNLKYHTSAGVKSGSLHLIEISAVGTYYTLN